MRLTPKVYKKRGRPAGLGSKWAWRLQVAVPAILEEYQGLQLTIRQIFYRLVGKYGLAKTENNYQYLDKLMVTTRKKGWIDWNRIVDLTRKPTYEEWTQGKMAPEKWVQFLKRHFVNGLSNYRIPVYENQEYLVEVWSEHEGLQPLFSKALENYPVTLYFTRGRNSWSNFYWAYENRLKTTSRKIIILHFADCDRFGKEMTKDIQEAFDYFKLNVKVVRVALDDKQVENWKLPDTQLEAIDPSKMAELVRDSVKKYIDEDKLKIAQEEMKGGQERINDWIGRFECWFEEEPIFLEQQLAEQENPLCKRCYQGPKCQIPSEQRKSCTEAKRLNSIIESLCSKCIHNSEPCKIPLPLPSELEKARCHWFKNGSPTVS